METIKIEKIEDFKSFVDSMKLYTKYILPDNSKFEWVMIDTIGTDIFNKEIKFCWCMEYSYKNSGNVGFLHPLITWNRIKSFKTESGAKRNFYKGYREYFENLK